MNQFIVSHLLSLSRISDDNPTQSEIQISLQIIGGLLFNLCKLEPGQNVILAEVSPVRGVLLTSDELSKTVSVGVHTTNESEWKLYTDVREKVRRNKLPGNDWKCQL